MHINRLHTPQQRFHMPGLAYQRWYRQIENNNAYNVSCIAIAQSWSTLCNQQQNKLQNGLSVALLYTFVLTWAVDKFCVGVKLGDIDPSKWMTITNITVSVFVQQHHTSLLCGDALLAIWCVLVFFFLHWKRGREYFVQYLLLLPLTQTDTNKGQSITTMNIRTYSPFPYLILSFFSLLWETETLSSNVLAIYSDAKLLYAHCRTGFAIVRTHRLAVSRRLGCSLHPTSDISTMIA